MPEPRETIHDGTKDHVLKPPQKPANPESPPKPKPSNKGDLEALLAYAKGANKPGVVSDGKPKKFDLAKTVLDFHRGVTIDPKNLAPADLAAFKKALEDESKTDYKSQSRDKHRQEYLSRLGK